MFELLLLRLDEQGLSISSPWPCRDGKLITENIWPHLWKAWQAKERWAGCRERDEDVQTDWDKAKLCLQACCKLGRARPAILKVSQLRGSQGQWLQVSDLRNQQCRLSSAEYAALTSWLTSAGAVAPEVEHANQSTQSLINRQHEAAKVSKQQFQMKIPPCIAGKITKVDEHGQLVLEYVSNDDIPDLDIAEVTDVQLAEYMCQTRAIFSFTMDGTDTHTVECLVPLSRVASSTFPQEFIIVQSTVIKEAPLTVLGTAFVRDSLLAGDCESLRVACTRPPWLVDCDDLGKWYPAPPPTPLRAQHQQWRLQVGGADGQTCMTGMTQSLRHSRMLPVSRPLVGLHPWQVDPPLPSQVSVDLSHHIPKNLLCPEGWEVIQRNGRVWIAGHNQRNARLDAAQYGMLLSMNTNQSEPGVPSGLLLQNIWTTCAAQQQADLEYHVHWNRHLLARLRQVTGATLLV